jgi:hypothetical protein
MAIVENLLARELFVRVGKQGFTLAAAPNPDGKHRREIEDKLVEKSERDGRAVVSDLIDAGKLKIVAGTFQGGIASRVVHGEVPALPGKVFDDYITFAPGSLISTPLAAIPLGAVILSAQLVVVEDVVAGGTSVKVGLGEGVVDPDLYGKTALLAAPSANSLLVLPWAALAGALALELNLVTAAGALGDTAPTAGKVRVKVSWIELADLPAL